MSETKLSQQFDGLRDDYRDIRHVESLYFSWLGKKIAAQNSTCQSSPLPDSQQNYHKNKL
jgi:hypothetical protein